MQEPVESELLARYLASEATPAERASVDAWVAADPANAAELARLRTAWAVKHKQSWDVEKAWARVQPRLDAAAPVVRIEARRRWHTLPVVRIAAAAVLVAGIAYVWRVGETETGAAVQQTFVTATGEQRSIDLADGTRIVIGPATELRVGPAYNDRDRRIELSGEAWFDVHHDAQRPFRVHARGTVTEDIGTSFSIRAIANDSIVRIALVEGSAAVTLDGAGRNSRDTLRAHDAADVNVRAAQVSVRRNANVDALVAWRSGRVEFSDTPLTEVAVELQRWYGVTTRFATPEIGRRLVTYGMPTTDLGEAIDVLRQATAVQIERRGDTLFVR